MGGVFENANFMQNCSAWDRLAESDLAESPLPRIRLAPVTGAIQNVGYADERLFYADLIRASARAGVCAA